MTAPHEGLDQEGTPGRRMASHLAWRDDLNQKELFLGAVLWEQGNNLSVDKRGPLAKVTWEKKLGVRKSPGCKRLREEQSDRAVLMEKQDSPTFLAFPRAFLFSFSDSWATVLRRTAHALSLSLNHHRKRPVQHSWVLLLIISFWPKWTSHLILFKLAYIE